MIARLPEESERYVEAQVQSGRFASSDEAIAEAVRLLRRREEAEEARMLDDVRQGLEDVRAGRTQPFREAIAEIRREEKRR
jgi:putative addiction module CopG family antidote